MRGSDTLNEIAPALVAAQGKLTNPRTDSKASVPTKSGGRFEYKFLSLPALLEYVRKTFRELGLALVQEVTEAQGGVHVTTRIIHLSGQWLDFGPLFMPATGGPQDVGGAITYGRRYSLAAAVGLAPEEDDDAQRAQSVAQQVPPATATPKQDAGPGVSVTSPPGPAPACDGSHHLGPLTPAPSEQAAKKGFTVCGACGMAGQWELIGA